MAKKILLIGSSLALGTTIVALLYALSGTPNTYKNGFSRKIRTDYLVSFHYKDLKRESYRIGGSTAYQLFLYSKEGSTDFLSCHFELSDLNHLPWTIQTQSGSNAISYQIDSPRLDLLDRRRSVISIYKLHNDNPIILSEDSIAGKPFDLGVRFSTSSFVLRTQNKNLNQYTLSKLNESNKEVIENDRVIKKQGEGFISTDGQLCYDSSLRQIIYVYYYRNQYLVLDSNLKLVKIFNTIDTVSQAEISVHLFEKEKLTTLNYPVVPTNKMTRVFKGRLYIQSGLLADNEDRKMFSNNFILDVYDIKAGNYLFSFYIPHFNQYKLDDFQVFDGLVMAVQGHFLVSYLIPHY